MASNKTIDEDEAKLYDRQIRLWGVEAQNRMKNSKVLLVGLRGLNTEVCKNIVLSGIDTAHILDPLPVDIADLSANFFLTPEDVGSNVCKEKLKFDLFQFVFVLIFLFFVKRAEACAERIRELNPRVNVVVDTESIDKKSDDFFTQFNVVCLSDCSIEIMVRIFIFNNQCIFLLIFIFR